MQLRDLSVDKTVRANSLERKKILEYMSMSIIIKMYEGMNFRSEWMKEWINEWINEWMNELVHVWMKLE